MEIPKSEPTGAIATDTDQLVPILHRAWSSPFTTRSDFARTNPEAVAVAACLGLITVRHHNTLTEWGRTWRITAQGLSLLENQE